MPRRTFLRFTTAHLPEPHIVASYLRALPPQQLHRDWRVFPCINSGSLFGNDAPLELEIGCGSAEQLCHLALQSPHTNFVGVDIARKSLEKGVEIAFSHRLRNIQFLYADFQQLYPLLVPRTLQTVYLHFPDPHLKPGHRKRRIFSPAFLDAIHSALIPGGRLSVMTDIESFLLDMLRLIETDSRFTRTHPERYLSGFTSGVRSHFQRVWEQHGETVYRFEYRTVMPPAGFSLTNLSRSK